MGLIALTTPREVLEAARWLVPPICRLRRRVVLNKDQKNLLRQAGYDPGKLHKEMTHNLYMGFRAIGCRTALWDSNL